MEAAALQLQYATVAYPGAAAAAADLLLPDGVPEPYAGHVVAGP